MKFSASLKLYFTAIMLIVSVALLLGYLVLARYYFLQGMDTAMVSDMQKAVETYQNDSQQLDQQWFLDNGLVVQSQWEELPIIYQQLFSPPSKINTLYKVETTLPNQRHPHEVYFLLKFQASDFSTVFVGKKLQIDKVPKVALEHAGRSFTTLHITIALIAIALIVLLFILVKSIGRPVETLGDWAKNLDSNSIKNPIPSFRYKELNQLAKLIQNGLQNAHQSLDREERFLKHASHELRTPIAVIRNNVELLQRLNPQPSNREKAILERLYRAGLTMSDLTNTLLWMSQEKVNDIPLSQFKLDNLLTELCDSLAYLLENKPVTTTLITEPHELFTAQIPCQIVITNLLRNAYQHSWSGNIYIEQKANELSITNAIDSAHENGGSHLGFGLGVSLVKQLCQQFNWEFESKKTRTEHYVYIKFCAAKTNLVGENL